MTSTSASIASRRPPTRIATTSTCCPNKDRSDKAAWARAQVEFLDSFGDVAPVDIDDEDLATLHTLPFRLVADKIVVQARVNGGRPQDFILDTGSEESVLSRETASRERVRPVTYTLSAGVGEVGLRGLQLARVKSLDFGTLQVRNLPVLIKNPALRGIPKREGESFSPLSIGMSMRIDYKEQLLTIGRHLPPITPMSACRCESIVWRWSAVSSTRRTRRTSWSTREVR